MKMHIEHMTHKSVYDDRVSEIKKLDELCSAIRTIIDGHEFEQDLYKLIDEVEDIATYHIDTNWFNADKMIDNGIPVKKLVVA